LEKHMKKLLLATAMVAAAAFATPAKATIIDVVGYNLPDGLSFNSVTTDGYSYYTGPIQLLLNDGTTLTVFCADLNHVLQPGLYQYGVLNTDGNGNAISAALSSRLGALAAAGLADLAASDYADAASVQAAIWDLEYGVTSTGNAAILADEATLEALVAAGNGARAVALIPFGTGWSENPSASQQLILGDGPIPTAVGEPGSLMLLAVGAFGVCAAAGMAGGRRIV
jgi:hypothetical protein